jgi:hypothetical protein
MPNGNGELVMSAYRKLGIVAIGALASMAIGLSTAVAQGHSSGGHGGGGGGGHSAGGGHYAAGGGHYAGGAHYAGGGYYGHGGYYSRGGYGGGYYGRGGYYGGRGGYYAGGYWHGWYGPRWGFGWFLPVLPAFYATYWFGGIPYYYANDSYYTWSPDYNGYVQTEPPAGAVPDDGSTPPPAGAPPPADNTPPPNGQAAPAPSAQPNGQASDQEANDRYQCHQWAVSQSGFDPTRNGAGAQGQADYGRAMNACMQGRGYTAR